MFKSVNFNGILFYVSIIRLGLSLAATFQNQFRLFNGDRVGNLSFLFFIFIYVFIYVFDYVFDYIFDCVYLFVLIKSQIYTFYSLKLT